MLYFYVSVAYTATNLLLAGTLLTKSRNSAVTRLYVFCTAALAVFGISAVLLEHHAAGAFESNLRTIVVFLYALIPFFFLHFIVIFLRRQEILRSRLIIGALYGTGLFSYAMILGGTISPPVTPDGRLENEVFIYFITWMSIFFSIGIAMLYSMLQGFTERLSKSNFLLSGFILLMLVLPSPFTESLHHLIFRDRTELYGVTSVLALVMATYLIFRHRIMVTVYDSVKSALSVLHDIFIITDASFNINIIRGALSRIGYDEAEMAGHFLNKFLMQKFYIEHYLDYVHSGRMRECRFDGDIICANGTTVLMDFSFSPIFENDQLSGFVGIARDISEQKKHAALRESEERFRRLAEDAQDVLYKFRFDPERGFEYVSPSAERITGYSVQEFYANPDMMLFIVNPRHRPTIELFFAGMGSFEKTITVEIIRKDGKPVWLEQRSTPVHDERGQLVGMGVIARDITERILLEEQLRQVQKLESLGTLAGGVAHDFNNTLGVILAYASQLSREELTPEAAGYVETIKKAVDRATVTVRELLTIARKSETSFAPVNINKSIEDLVGMLASTFPKNIFLMLELDRIIPPVYGDANQIHQALFNLCVNARDAMPDGGTITISTRMTSAPAMIKSDIDTADERYIRIRIADTGTGIAEEIRERIFEPFYTTKDIGKGTGLGLALVQGIAKSHHGCITVDSWPGDGTSFDLFLPVMKGKSFESADTSDSVARTVEDYRGNETILFVEDEEMLAKLLTGLLQEAGYTVITAHNGGEALERFIAEGDRIDLLLTDIGLPGMNGWNLYQTIKRQRPAMPVIFASGFLDPSVHAEMTMHGARHFIQKPYRPAEVIESIRSVLDNTGTSGKKE